MNVHQMTSTAHQVNKSHRSYLGRKLSSFKFTFVLYALVDRLSSQTNSRSRVTTIAHACKDVRVRRCKSDFTLREKCFLFCSCTCRKEHEGLRSCKLPLVIKEVPRPEFMREHRAQCSSSGWSVFPVEKPFIYYSEFVWFICWNMTEQKRNNHLSHHSNPSLNWLSKLFKHLHHIHL